MVDFFSFAFLLLLLRFWQPLDEGLTWCSAVHAAALMMPALIVTDKEVVENGLHLVDRLEPSAPTFDAEVLVEPGAMEALHDRMPFDLP